MRFWRPIRALGPCSLALLALAGLPAVARATWVTDGDLVVGTTAAPASPVLIPGSASFFAAWVDGRTGYNTDVRATRWTIGGAAAAGWLADGNPVTDITCRKYSLAGVPDGAGGALYTWSDDRCVGVRRIYACRMTSAGSRAAGWAANGLRIAPTSANQLTPVIAAEAGGGSFVAWQDHRGAVAQVYVQRLTPDGAIASGWPADGVAVAPGSNIQSRPQIAGDGAGGIFVAWIEQRAGSDDVCLQRLTSAGAVAGGWAAGGTVVCNAPGNQLELLMIADGASGAYLAWRDPRTGDDDVRALRVTAAGAVAAGWTAGGSLVTSAPGNQSGLRIARDGALGLLLAWQDHRAASWDVYAMRLGPGGAPATGWAAGGIAIAASADDQMAPALDADGAGGAWLAWQSGTPGAFDLDAIRLDANGAVSAGWKAGGTRMCAATGDQVQPVLTAVSGNAIVAWSDFRAGAAVPALYSFRLTPSGPLPVTVSGLGALHHDGQTFLHWTPPPDTGWTFRVYRRGAPITTEADLAGAALLGSVGDSSATDRRLSALSGEVLTFRPDSAAPLLAPTQGLFVVTVPNSRQSWYAVTAQARGASEDRHVIAGGNSIAGAGVAEVLAMPRPVFQRTRSCGPVSQDVYTLWTWNTDTPLFPAMSNRPSQPFDCGVTRGAGNAPAFVRPHPRMGAFTLNCQASGALSEWILALDDYTSNQDVCTYYYGYHPDYDATSDANTPPTSGAVVDYTNRRMLHTIDWWRRTFPFDTTRHYAFGYSLGGTYAMRLGIAYPDRIVAAMSVVGKVDFSYESEPDANAAFNPGKPYREALSRLWGTTATNLSNTQALPVYSMVNDGALATMTAGPGAAYIVNFAGRNDIVVGWGEKIPFYQSLETNRIGGAQYWDNRDHYSTMILGGFGPMTDLTWLYRFRSNLSWPAFSHGSANDDPGNGWLASGDSLGTLNGYMDWDPAVTDTVTVWGVTLRTRALTTLWGVIAAPETVTVDVTPRRLQQFRPTPGVLVSWKAVRLADGAEVQAGTVAVDAQGRVTVPGVKTYRTGTRLTLTATPSWLDAGPPSAGGLAFTSVANPIRGSGVIALTWPRAGDARLELFDAFGRRARVLWTGAVAPGPWTMRMEQGALAPGVYHLRATQGEQSTTRRLALLR